jgi:hypothetical protein
MRLRLAPKARKPNSPNRARPVSAHERLALENEQD